MYLNAAHCVGIEGVVADRQHTGVDGVVCAVCVGRRGRGGYCVLCLLDGGSGVGGWGVGGGRGVNGAAEVYGGPAVVDAACYVGVAADVEA